MKCKGTLDGCTGWITAPFRYCASNRKIRKRQDVTRVAAACGGNVRILRWLADLANGGQMARAKPTSGRPPKVNTNELRWLVKPARDNTSLGISLAFSLWPLSRIAALIEREFGKRLPKLC